MKFGFLSSQRPATAKIINRIFSPANTTFFLLWLLVFCLPAAGRAQGTLPAYSISFPGAPAIDGHVPLSVVWDPNYQVYYSTTGGSSTSNYIYNYAVSGSQLALTSGTYNCRGNWYNPGTAKVEGNFYDGSSFGYYVVNAGTGYATGSVTTYFTGGTATPNNSAGGVLNTLTGEVLMFDGTSTVYRYNRSNGSLQGTFSITVPSGSLFTYAQMIYTNSTDNRIGFYDRTNRRVYLYPASGGSYNY